MQKECHISAIGILQGRLTLPTNDQLQCFPISWEKEFSLAKSSGIDTIELLFEKEKNDQNPLWSRQKTLRLKNLAKAENVHLPSLCADFFMSHPIFSSSRNDFHDIESHFQMLVDRCEDLDISIMVIPCFEKGEAKNEEEKKRFGSNLRHLTQRIRKTRVRLALETTWNGHELEKFVHGLDDPHVAVCYDTGNTTAFNHDQVNDIEILGGLITHVHVKDRLRNGGPNVLLGTGNTPFESIFSTFRNIKYSGDFILETIRGDDPVATANRHVFFIQNHWQATEKAR